MSTVLIPDDASVPEEVMALAVAMIRAGRSTAEIAATTGISAARVDRLRPAPPKARG